MPQIVNGFSNGGHIEFAAGSFDNWCVYLKLPGEKKFAPADIFYFERLQQLAKQHSFQEIYDDFVIIYNRTTKQITPEIFDLIFALSRFYSPDEDEIEIWFNVLYAGMVAEENKKNAILKKRIKRLGMYQLLIEKKTPEFAAGFSKGKNWKDLDAIMKLSGF